MLRDRLCFLDPDHIATLEALQFRNIMPQTRKNKLRAVAGADLRFPDLVEIAHLQLFHLVGEQSVDAVGQRILKLARAENPQRFCSPAEQQRAGHAPGLCRSPSPVNDFVARGSAQTSELEREAYLRFQATTLGSRMSLT